ncbi:hypothetical protein J4E08_22365 [Sagittula sp. NFXS13]|uniref:Uncharacterized protein n=1 Tax=Sagittula marina TaxID=943940 RepID=A0A7W6GST5_9RHOB|nr:hypothetical protein [Sagittula marina]MBB3986132.1 hypothetical protein [Sagittula marina]
MEWIVWIGAALSLIGLIGLLMSIVKVWRARSGQLSDDEIRETVRRAMPLNLGSLFLSTIGLMMVIVGIFLI